MKIETLIHRDGSEERHPVRLIATVSSNHARPAAIRWSELSLYQAAAGGLICQEIGRSVAPGEVDRYRLVHAADAAELVLRVGYGWLAKQLYAQAGIEHAQHLTPGSMDALALPTHYLTCNEAPDLAFHGFELKRVSTDRPAPHQRQRWTELRMYQLPCGLLVCHELGCTRVEGELTRCRAHIAETPFAMRQALGEGRLGRELYAALGWSRSPDHVAGGTYTLKAA